MAAKTKAPAGAQYWTASLDTHKADTSYYALVTESLHRTVLPLLSGNSRVLDFGCGNGEYTELLSAASGPTLGIDVSEPLIDEARRMRSSPGTSFAVAHRPPAAQSFDLVSCMGVLVCVLDDTDFESILTELAHAVRPNGHLVLRETFAWNDAQIVENDDYVAHYRTPLQYLTLLADCGIELLTDEHLVTWSEHQARSNHLWLLTRPT